ncbi:hypothetical protein RHMOL_Rhmol02G0024100 [Rhododendron molle]|uniref:Uncharacterized protein n=1 Tax=Rhododendron molle TaxID=49168 RepID=A0ACC0PKW0_RHOML|nr:hypothetical protein RHMOL_Rhmol02G0024100 [Rhododendron molle]
MTSFRSKPPVPSRRVLRFLTDRSASPWLSGVSPAPVNGLRRIGFWLGCWRCSNYELSCAILSK